MSEDQNNMDKGYHLEENQIAEFKVPCPHCKSEIRVLVYEPQQLSFMFEEVIKCECGGKSAIKWDYGKQTILGIAKVDFKETRIKFHKVHEIRELTDEEVEAIQAQAQAEIKEAQAKGVTCFDNPYDHELEEEKYCIYHDVIMDVAKEINPIFAVKVLDPHGRVTEVEDKPLSTEEYNLIVSNTGTNIQFLKTPDVTKGDPGELATRISSVMGLDKKESE